MPNQLFADSLGFNQEHKNFAKYDGPPTVFEENSFDDFNKHFYDEMRNTKRRLPIGTIQTTQKTTDSLTELLIYKEWTQLRKFGEKPRK